MIPNSYSSKKRSATEALEESAIKRSQYDSNSSSSNFKDNQIWPEDVLTYLGVKKDDMHIFISNLKITEELMMVCTKWKQQINWDEERNDKNTNQHEKTNFSNKLLLAHPKLLLATYDQFVKLKKTPGSELFDLIAKTLDSNPEIKVTPEYLSNLLKNIVSKIEKETTPAAATRDAQLRQQLIKIIIKRGISALADPINLNFEQHPIFAEKHTLELRNAYARLLVTEMTGSANIELVEGNWNVECYNKILDQYEEKSTPNIKNADSLPPLMT